MSNKEKQECGCKHDEHKNCDCKEHEEDKNEKQCEKKQLKEQIKNLQEELETANKAIDLLNENYGKQEALNKSLNISCVELKNDIERIKERNKNIVQDANDNAIINVAKDFLPILDNFEAALKVCEDDKVLHGFELIYNQTKTMLKNMGVEEIEAIGKDFDPEIHNAVMKETPKDAKDSGKVASEFQKGYKFKDKIVRHTTVSVFE